MASELLNLHRQLRWSDFGTPSVAPPPLPGHGPTAALTHADFTYSLHVELAPNPEHRRYRLKDDVRIEVVFQRPPSWAATWVFDQTAEEQARLLRHEQGHYDLVALLVRDMYTEIVGLRSHEFNIAQAVGRAAFAIRDRFHAKFEPVQQHYDTATNHSNNHAQQDTWNGYIHTAFTQPRSPPQHAPDGAPYNVTLMSVLHGAGIHL